ncbi:hypothetical protein V498_07968 [Pseudogymnoascus sp. VKM F-4517 (FW-2822)]|nr:hypothetical protein V498_07968 [Pseudogymnoascus sp. VKM F-4517 (FW-2822)]
MYLAKGTGIPDDLYLRNSEPLPPYNPQSHFTSSSAEQNQISTRSVLEKVLLRPQTYTCSGTQILLIHTILSTALDFHAAAIYELSLARYRLNSGHTNRPKESYKSMLISLNWPGGWIGLHEFVHVSLGDIRNIGLRSLPQGEARQLMEIEVQSLEAAHMNAQRNQVQILEFLRQEQEINFTRRVGRLTTIAFLFLPFSTVATILSIQDSMRFGVFVGMALPMLVICIVAGIWGASTADTINTIGDWSRVSWMRCAAYLRELCLLSGIKKTVKGPDVESKPESSVCHRYVAELLANFRRLGRKFKSAQGAQVRQAQRMLMWTSGSATPIVMRRGRNGDYGGAGLSKSSAVPLVTPIDAASVMSAS